MRDIFKPDKKRVDSKIRILLNHFHEESMLSGKAAALREYHQKFKDLIWNCVIEGEEDINWS